MPLGTGILAVKRPVASVDSRPYDGNTMPRVQCKSCRQWTEAQLLEAPDLLLCLECGTLCDEPNRIEVDAPALTDAPNRASPELPRGCTIEEIASNNPSDASRRERPLLRIKGPEPKRSPLMVALALIGILVLFIGIAAGLVVGEQPGLGILTLPAAAVAVVFVYISLVPNGSRRVITMGDEALLLARKPFPWRKRYLSRRFVTLLDARACHDETEGRTYEVVAVLQSGERVVLLGGFGDPRVAMHLGRRAQMRWS